MVIREPFSTYLLARVIYKYFVSRAYQILNKSKKLFRVGTEFIWIIYIPSIHLE